MELTSLTMDLETGQGNNNHNNNENININSNILSLDTITEEESAVMDKNDANESKRGSTANSSNNVSRAPSTGDMSPGTFICNLIVLLCSLFFFLLF